MLTNLRLIWCRQDRPSTNLSIGFNCIITLESRRAKSRLRGSTQSLRVLTKFNGTRFEFIFTSLVKSNPRLFGTIQAVRKSYESTKLYRNVKLRSAIVDDGKLMILPQEEVINTLSGVWNLSTDQGNLGTLITTNVRVVWFAHMAENFCVSAPWMQARPHVMCNSSLIRMRSLLIPLPATCLLSSATQVKDITLKDTSKFGTALVIDILPAAGGYKMGFNLEPKEQLESMFQELLSLFAVFRATPVFGVDFKEEGMRKIGDTEADAAAPSVLDDLNVVQAENEGPASFPAYLLDPSKEQDREVVFDPHLGLAVEGLLGNTTTTSLWQAVATLAPVDTEGRRASQQMGRKHGPDHGPQPTGPGGHQAAEYKCNVSHSSQASPPEALSLLSSCTLSPSISPLCRPGLRVHVP